MKEFLLVVGLVSKSWIGGKYRGYLLHLDPQTRRNRFCDGVPDQFIRNYDDTTLNIRFLNMRSARSNEISSSRSFFKFQGAGVIKFLTTGIAIAGLLGALHVLGAPVDVLASASHVKRRSARHAGNRRVMWRLAVLSPRVPARLDKYEPRSAKGSHHGEDQLPAEVISRFVRKVAATRRIGGINGSIGSTDHLTLFGSAVRHGFGGTRSRWRLSHGYINYPRSRRSNRSSDRRAYIGNYFLVCSKDPVTRAVAGAEKSPAARTL